MINFGINEGVIIGIVTLILIRPKDIPKMTYTMGKWYQKWMRSYYAITDELTSIHENIKKIQPVVKRPQNTSSQSDTAKNNKDLID